MKRTRTLVGMALAAVALLAACAPRPRFEEFASAEGRFKVLMPGQPSVKILSQLGVTMRTFRATQGKDWSFTVAYFDVPQSLAMSDETVQAALDSALEGTVKDAHATLKTSSRILLDGKYPGRSLEAEFHAPIEGLLRARIYMVDRRAYQIAVAGAAREATSDDATRFLESFTLTH